MKKVCVLVSGGFDSSVLIAHYLRRGFEVHPLFVCAGFLWEKAELYWLTRFLRAMASPRLKPLAVARTETAGLGRNHWGRSGIGTPGFAEAWTRVNIPGRNLLLLSQAAVLSSLRRIPLIAVGVLKGNPFSDATPAFRRRMAATASAALDWRLRIEAPFARLTKKQVARLIPGLPVHLTFSCLKPRGIRPCGRCAKCEEMGWVQKKEAPIASGAPLRVETFGLKACQ